MQIKYLESRGLLQFIIENAQGPGFSKWNIRDKIDHLLTYCDRRYSIGNSYNKFGRYIGKTEPGYSWHSFGGWYSRYQTQKSKLKNLFPDYYKLGLTEKNIMETAGYFQLYDCGNLKYILN